MTLPVVEQSRAGLRRGQLTTALGDAILLGPRTMHDHVLISGFYL